MCKKHSIFSFLFFAFFYSYYAQNTDSIWVVNNYTKQEIMVKMRDGVSLYTSVYSPKSNSLKQPILMMRTPYSCTPYGSNNFNPRLYSAHWIKYLKKGYIMVLQDVRGRYMSEGEYMDVRPFNENKLNNETDEASDSYDIIDWLVKNIPNNNGNVGVFGISYPGFYSTMAALSNHPALKAVSPQAPVTDWFMGDDFHHNGAFALMDGFSFYSAFGKPRPKPTTVHEIGFEFPENDAYQFYLKQGALKNLTKHMSGIKFWNDLMQHPNYDDWWKKRDARIGCKNIKAATLIVGGTFDAEDCFGAWNLYKAIENQSKQTTNKIVMGPWFHGGWHRSSGSYLGNVRFEAKTSQYYQDNIEIPFFDYYLKNQQNSKLPNEASVFFTGINKWEFFNEWPIKTLKPTALYFTNNNKLSFDNNIKNDLVYKYISNPQNPVPYADGVHLNRTKEYMIDDQRFVSKRADVLVLETDVLNKDIKLGGPLVADLNVSLSSTDADFVVKLIDVFPDDFKYNDTVCCKGVKQESNMGGYQMLVRGEIMRGRFRNSFEKPSAFTPNKIENVKFTLPDVAHVFKKGHKIMVQIQSSWFPLFDRNPQQFIDIYKCDDKDFIECEIKVHTSKNNASKLILPIIN
ncbi:MAG: CocE/NonD family hydrolase [Bacteroidetes bacterium]|nr:CocE/NonD family hydrolase [Bacteroidota bacterium]